ncbi:predicted protein [Histoplasma capsulatum var. duboisii H88]|uniref:Predicted protein n=1 Tax=Ajellomyces capsulatus (strain H88) TaxID=544711 RepID=F0UNU1_AJEC8|nr:predicted protein [Histoplasma capsulatum var. duboisii H88]
MAYNVKSECHTWKARISHSRHFRTANAIIDISPGGGGPGKGEFRIHTSHALHPSVQPHSTRRTKGEGAGWTADVDRGKRGDCDGEQEVRQEGSADVFVTWRAELEARTGVKEGRLGPSGKGDQGEGRMQPHTHRPFVYLVIIDQLSKEVILQLCDKMNAEAVVNVFIRSLFYFKNILQKFCNYMQND